MFVAIVDNGGGRRAKRGAHRGRKGSGTPRGRPQRLFIATRCFIIAP